MYVYMYVCMYACMHVCMCMYVYMYVCAYVRTYVCKYVCMYVCMYAVAIYLCIFASTAIWLYVLRCRAFAGALRGQCFMYVYVLVGLCMAIVVFELRFAIYIYV